MRGLEANTGGRSIGSNPEIFKPDAFAIEDLKYRSIDVSFTQEDNSRGGAHTANNDVAKAPQENRRADLKDAAQDADQPTRRPQRVNGGLDIGKVADGIHAVPNGDCAAVTDASLPPPPPKGGGHRLRQSRNVPPPTVQVRKPRRQK